MSKILVVDNDGGARLGLIALLKEEGYDVSGVKDEMGAIDALGKMQYDVVVTELFMPHFGCERILDWVKKHAPMCEVIILTTHGSIDFVVKAMKLGSFDYILRPFKADELIASIEKVFQRHGRDQYCRNVKEPYSFDEIVAISTSMRTVIETALKVSEIDTNVLIYGESGTGKELVARAIHNNSKSRKDHPFIAINCAAVPDNILESELFGYVRGSFTGAVRDKNGLFEAANHGTLFLDEIGDSSPQFQSKLLRVIERKEVRRIGDDQTRKIDVRVIAATNKDVPAMAAEGTFRSDLYYRLGVVDIMTPPLRERKEDIYPLVTHILRDISHRLGKKVEKVSEEVMQVLLAYDWPGNVRELKNSLERAVILTGENYLQPADFPLAYDHSQKRMSSSREEDIVPLKEIEKRYLLKAVRKYSYNYRIAAKKLGIGYTTLWRKMKEFEIDL